MLAHSYTAEHFGVSNHDVYHKPPVLKFELHTALFGSAQAEPLYKYYADVKRLLVKDEGNGYGYHFSEEDLQKIYNERVKEIAEKLAEHDS
jgi:hypothetical protein